MGNHSRSRFFPSSSLEERRAFSIFWLRPSALVLLIVQCLCLTSTFNWSVPPLPQCEPPTSHLDPTCFCLASPFFFQWINTLSRRFGSKDRPSSFYLCCCFSFFLRGSGESSSNLDGLIDLHCTLRLDSSGLISVSVLWGI